MSSWPWIPRYKKSSWPILARYQKSSCITKGVCYLCVCRVNPMIWVNIWAFLLSDNQRLYNFTLETSSNRVIKKQNYSTRGGMILKHCPSRGQARGRSKPKLTPCSSYYRWKYLYMNILVPAQHKTLLLSFWIKEMRF